MLSAIEEKHEHVVPRVIRSRLIRRNRALLDLRAAPAFQSSLGEPIWFTHTQKAIEQYDLWVKKREANRYDSNPLDPVIVITETVLQENYISFCENNIGIISAAEWEKFFKPASALEYILTSIQRLSLRLCYGSVIGSHYPTRGCLWDYNINVPDVRISAFLGFLCETCRNGLKKAISQTDYDEIVRLIENRWIGNRESSSSVAGILAKNYKYDLSRSTGLNPGFMATIRRSMQSEVGRTLLDILKWLAILLLTIFLASHFPSISKFLTK